MAKIVSFTHPRNLTPYSGAYAALSVVDINKPQRTAFCRFDVWRSQAAFAAGAQIVHSSGFTISGDEFVTALTDESTHQKSVSEIAYEHAATKLLVDPNNPESGLLFEDATDA